MKLNMRLLSLSLILPLASTVLPAEKGDAPTLGDASKLPPAATQTGVNYDKDIKPLIEKSCLKCHSGDKPKSKYSMENKESLIKGGKTKAAAVVAGASAKSPLVHYAADLVEDMEMPPKDKRDKYTPWTKDQIALVRAWIDQGAK